MNDTTTSDHGLRCQPMDVAFTDSGVPLMPGFQLVVPTGSIVVHATGRDDLGTSRSMAISSPFTAIVPHRATLATIAGGDRNGWVIALESGEPGLVWQEAFSVCRNGLLLGPVPARGRGYTECFA